MDEGGPLPSHLTQSWVGENDAAHSTRSAAAPEAMLTPSGEPLPDLVRRAYGKHAPAIDGDAGAVFAGAVAVLNAPSQDRAALSDLPVTVLYDEIWQNHAGLRQRFAIDRVAGRLAYLRWLVEAGAAELEIPADFMVPARVALDRERVRQLEAGDEEKTPPASPANGAAPGQPASADIERDIRLLVSSNKALRRDVVSLQVRTWRHEETIAALQKDLTQTRASRAAAIRRGRQLESLHRGRPRFATKLGGRARKAAAETVRRPFLTGDEPFFSRGFLLGGSSAIVGTAAERIINAPSGIMIFGPYVKLAAGTYAAAVEARLYQRLPLWADFKIEVACDGAEQIIAERWVRVFSGARWRRRELVFTVWDGEDYPDFEIRIWARSRTPLAIGRIDLFELATAAQNGDA
jgi:hypothetical protein